jgi:polyhydroxybutyrate depolymerase
MVRDVTLQQGGLPRKYLIVQPTDLAEGEQVPMVLALHGIGVDRFGMKAAADWEEAVAEDRFIAVFPEGTLGSWNAGPCCPPATLVGAGDLGFIDLVIDDVTSGGHVDPERIHATGFSNGAMMIYHLACQRTEVFASVLPMAGVNINGCKPKQPIPTLHLHGDPDSTVPYDGSFSAANLLSGGRFPAVPDSVNRWATDQGCATDPEVEVSGKGKTEMTSMTWTGCPEGTGVELIAYPGNGHSWPKGEVDGLTEIREFFELSQ